MRTDFFSPIALDQMDQVKLMNRTDTKYWFNIKCLQELLDSIKDSYYILTINDKVQMPYLTTYFDTIDNKMFIAHHNGKLNRYKVRRRSYLSSDISFLEVKFKSNKGRTIKKRINTKIEGDLVSPIENEFLHNNSPFDGKELQPVLHNRFTRLMLVNKNFKERCTIDFDLRFEQKKRSISLNDLVIVEIKSDGNTANSPLAKTLRDSRIKTAGFSKYCVGRTVTDYSIKRNAFKSKIRAIEKTIDSNAPLYSTY